MLTSFLVAAALSRAASESKSERSKRPEKPKEPTVRINVRYKENNYFYKDERDDYDDGGDNGD